jgi:hypothetical protein
MKRLTDGIGNLLTQRLMSTVLHPDGARAPLSMITIMFYLGALGLFGLGSLLIRHTSPYSRSGGAKYERKRTRKIVGVILLIAGVLLLGLGVLRQFFSSFS